MGPHSTGYGRWLDFGPQTDAPVETVEVLTVVEVGSQPSWRGEGFPVAKPSVLRGGALAEADPRAPVVTMDQERRPGAEAVGDEQRLPDVVELFHHRVEVTRQKVREVGHDHRNRSRRPGLERVSTPLGGCQVHAEGARLRDDVGTRVKCMVRDLSIACHHEHCADRVCGQDRPHGGGGQEQRYLPRLVPRQLQASLGGGRVLGEDHHGRTLVAGAPHDTPPALAGSGKP